MGGDSKLEIFRVSDVVGAVRTLKHVDVEHEVPPRGKGKATRMVSTVTLQVAVRLGLVRSSFDGLRMSGFWNRTRSERAEDRSL